MVYTVNKMVYTVNKMVYTINKMVYIVNKMVIGNVIYSFLWFMKQSFQFSAAYGKYPPVAIETRVT